MSSARLKKRAAEDDSLQNNNLNESFVQYGTPLPSLASTKKDQGEYVPIWQQEVRDEQGRRRLHGAFTGGFSAGYYNTAGSKEGWTPSTFVSKKEAKGKQRAEQRPEDFMDEEDLAELKASKTFQTSENYGGGQSRPQDAFAGLGSTSASSSSGANKQDPGYSAAVANSLQDLVKPGSRRIGQKIMTKMGWRPGQGIGPRISYARRKQQMKEMGMEADDEEEEDDEEAKKHTFAPLDRTILTFEQKENQWGLGYVPGQPLGGRFEGPATIQSASYTVPVSDQARFGRNGQKGDTGPQSRMPVGGAFGISALEDADEDDIDVYGAGPPGSTTTVLHEEDDEDGFESYGGGSRKPELLRWNNRTKRDSNKIQSPDHTAVKPSGQTFSDGSPMLPGFVLANRVQPPDKWFAPENIPQNWQPNPRAIWERERLKAVSPAQAGTANIPGSQRKGQQNMLSADDRASILGEPVAPKSIFDFLSAKDRERLEGLGQQDSGSTTKPTAAGPAPAPEVLRVPTIDARVAQSALKGFMPYGDDHAKQARYKAFLQHFAMPQDANKPFRPSFNPGKGISEQNAELEAFANAAMIFKPMSGMMANRFTSSSQTALLDIKAPEAGLHLPKPVTDSQRILAQNEEEEKRKKQQEREAADPRRAAVREGNFGPLTRTVQPWYPVRLLCKRFNVADPHPEGAPNGSSSSSHSYGQSATSQPESEVLNKHAMDSMMQDRKANNAGDGFIGGISFTSGAGAAPTASSLDTVAAPDDDSQDQDVLTYEKPSMDIFKAIFASDDEDNEDEASEKDEAAPHSQTATLDDPSLLPDTSLFDNKRAEPAASLTIEDLSSFRPTFVSRTDRSTTKEDSKKKERDKKKKKKTAAVLSFALEDGEEEAPSSRSVSSSKKRKADSKDKELQISKKERKEAEKPSNDEEDDEWVEKEVTPIVPHNTGKNAEQGNAHRKGTRVTASQLF